MAAEIEWLRIRGMGRERFAGHLADFLASLGYTVERTDQVEPAESRVGGTLSRMNPAVPECAKQLAFRLWPTSSGAVIAWVSPTEVPANERARLDRLAREITQHLERTVLTESHATARVSRAPDTRLPWESGA